MTQSKIGKDSIYEEYDGVYETYEKCNELKQVNQSQNNRSEENDEVYEEYAEYRERNTSNSRNEQFNCGIWFEKLSNKKRWIIFTALFSAVVGLAAGLAIHLTGSSIPTETTTTSIVRTTTVAPAPKAVLMLSTFRSTNVPMVIALNG